MATPRTFTASRELGHGVTCFDEARTRLMTWQVQQGAGFRVEPATPVELGHEYVLHIGVGRARLTAPVRVTHVVDDVEIDEHRAGFTYETLPGHPEDGEESFMLEHDLTSDVVRFVVTATSRPGTWWMRLGAPLGRLAQDAATRRYLKAIQPGG